MTRPGPGRPHVDDPEAVKAEWLRRLDDLLMRVKGWAEDSGWKTRVIQKSMRDSVLGPYKAPALLLQRETVEVILDPVGRFAPGTEGVVDLYLLPAYDDIASLFLRDGSWRLCRASRATSGEAIIKSGEAMTLDAATLDRVLGEIAAHAA